MLTPTDELYEKLQKLDAQLLELLRSLRPEQWQAPTVCKGWRVKDISAHLLDGNYRRISMMRDGYFGEAPPADPSYTGLVRYLNLLNQTWVDAFRRVSPLLLMELLAASGPEFIAALRTRKPTDAALFPVAWAGQQESTHGMDVAREYTEKWLHQQQIRDAVGRPGILDAEFGLPAFDSWMFGIPARLEAFHPARPGAVEYRIPDLAGANWAVVWDGETWRLAQPDGGAALCRVEVPADVAWRLFGKHLRPEAVRAEVKVTGDERLAAAVLGTVSVMA